MSFNQRDDEPADKQELSVLLSHAQHWDSDKRYMAVRSLAGIALENPNDSSQVKRAIDTIIDRINEDNIAEIQAEGLRCLGNIVPIIPPALVKSIVHKTLTLRSIPSMNGFAILKVIVNSTTAQNEISGVLLPAMRSLLLNLKPTDIDSQRETLQIIISLSSIRFPKNPDHAAEALELLLQLAGTTTFPFRDDAAAGVFGFASSVDSQTAATVLLRTSNIWLSWDVAIFEGNRNPAAITEAMPCLKALSQCLKGCSSLSEQLIHQVKSRVLKGLQSVAQQNSLWTVLHLSIVNSLKSSILLDHQTLASFINYGVTEDDESIEMSDIEEMDDFDAAAGSELPDSWTVRYEAVAIAMDNKLDSLVPHLIKQLNIETSATTADLIVDCLTKTYLNEASAYVKANPNEISLSNNVNLGQKLRFFKAIAKHLGQPSTLCTEVLRNSRNMPAGAMFELFLELLQLDQSVARILANNSEIWSIDSPKCHKLLVKVICKLDPVDEKFISEKVGVLKNPEDIINVGENVTPNDNVEGFLYGRLLDCLKTTKLHPREFRRLISICGQSARAREILGGYLSSQTISLFKKDAIPVEDVRDALNVFQSIHLPDDFNQIVEQRINYPNFLVDCPPSRIGAYLDLLRYHLTKNSGFSKKTASFLTSRIFHKLESDKEKWCPYHPVPAKAYGELIRELVAIDPQNRNVLQSALTSAISKGDSISFTLAWYGLKAMDETPTQKDIHGGRGPLADTLLYSTNQDAFEVYVNSKPDAWTIIGALRQIALSSELLKPSLTDSLVTYALQKETDDMIAEILSLVISTSSNGSALLQLLSNKYKEHPILIPLAAAKCTLPSVDFRDRFISTVISAKADSLEEKRARILALERFVRQGILPEEDQIAEISKLIESNDLLPGEISQLSAFDFGAFKKVEDKTAPYRRAAWEFIATCKECCPDLVNKAVQNYHNSASTEHDTQIKEVISRCVFN